MVKYQGPSRRRKSGAYRRKSQGKKLRFLARPPVETQIGEPRKQKIRTLGGNTKLRLKRMNSVNVLDKETGKLVKTMITGVESNQASRDYSRRKIITKGAIITTEFGSAKVTNRPGSDSVINAILLKE